MKFAYADPPYIGQAKKHYNSNEVDYAELIKKLINEYPDGWALSCSSPSLKQILPMVPSRCRIMAWVKPFCSWKQNVNPAYAWEPIIVYGGRNIAGKEQKTIRDWVSANITLKKGVHGAKPKEFCFWLFEILGMEKEDVLDDLYPGTEIVGKALEEWRNKNGNKRTQ